MKLSGSNQIQNGNLRVLQFPEWKCAGRINSEMKIWKSQNLENNIQKTKFGSRINLKMNVCVSNKIRNENVRVLQLPTRNFAGRMKSKMKNWKSKKHTMVFYGSNKIQNENKMNICGPNQIRNENSKVWTFLEWNFPDRIKSPKQICKSPNSLNATLKVE